MMKKFLLPCCVFLLSSFPVAAETLTLSKDTKTDYRIVLPDAATPVEQTAAQELKQHLDAVTGTAFPIIKESEVETDGQTVSPRILIGNTKRTKELLPELDAAKLPYDGIVIKTVGKDLVLTGHPQRGTLYAVYSLLEDTVGVRWWTSTESFLPKKPTLEIPEQNIQYAPKLIYRECYYRDAFDGVFASRMKCNGNAARCKPEYGDHHRFQYFVHSFFPLLPPEKYFEKHPEWYSEINGKRKHEHAQLCLTNNAMRAELTKNAIESLRKNPLAKFISISQNDWHGFCTCPQCKAVDEEEGGQAGTLIRFVNQVAEDIEKEFPDVWVETLAYQYTRKPPKRVKPRKNVVIRLCSIECSFVQTLADGEQNKAFRDDIEGWSKIADSLFIWDYTVNFVAYMLPHPNHRVLASNIRFFVDNNTIGLFEQGDAHCTAGDFARIKNWVMSRLQWNPELDEKKLYDEFLVGYYGPGAAPIIKEYLELIHDQAEKSGVFLRCFMETTTGWLDAETTLKAHTLMEKAVAAAGDETFRNRVRRDKMPIDLVVLRDYLSIRRKADLAGKTVSLPDNPQILSDDFTNRCKEFGVTSYNESGGVKKLNDVLDGLKDKFGPPAPTPEFCKDLSKESWYEIQNFELNTYKFGELTFRVEDKTASNGRAVKMPGDHYEWATSYTFDNILLDLKPVAPAEPASAAGTEEKPAQPTYRLYAAVRCDAKATEGKAMTLGVYDYTVKKGVTSKTLNVPDIVGPEYRWIDMGSLALKPGHNFWFAPPRRPGEVEAVYIDRIIVVREK